MGGYCETASMLLVISNDSEIKKSCIELYPPLHADIFSCAVEIFSRLNASASGAGVFKGRLKSGEIKTQGSALQTGLRLRRWI